MVIIATPSYTLATVDAYLAAWSLIARDPWDWNRFWRLFAFMVFASMVSAIVQALALRDDEIAQAMRTGFLPLDADPETWRGRIAGRVRQAQVIGAFLPPMCVTSAVLTALAAHLNNNYELQLWVLAIVGLLLVLPLVWVLVRIHRRQQRLLARL